MIEINNLLGLVVKLRVDAALPHRVCEMLDQLTGVFPTDARIGNA